MPWELRYFDAEALVTRLRMEHPYAPVTIKYRYTDVMKYKIDFITITAEEAITALSNELPEEERTEGQYNPEIPTRLLRGCKDPGEQTEVLAVFWSVVTIEGYGIE